jgi:hypothetical protein
MKGTTDPVTALPHPAVQHRQHTALRQMRRTNRCQRFPEPRPLLTPSPRLGVHLLRVTELRRRMHVGVPHGLRQLVQRRNHPIDVPRPDAVGQHRQHLHPTSPPTRPQHRQRPRLRLEPVDAHSQISLRHMIRNVVGDRQVWWSSTLATAGDPHRTHRHHLTQ